MSILPRPAARPLWALFVVFGVAGALALGSGVSVAAADQAPLEVWAAVSAAPLVADVGGAEEATIVVRADATSRIVSQIEYGAPADVLVTADREWMSESVTRGLVAPADARPMALNRLVLLEAAAAAPAEADDLAEVTATQLEALITRGSGPLLAVAGPSVPAGRYARQALDHLGFADRLADRLVTASSARAVANTVLSGEVPFGIGYGSDAVSDSTLRIAGVFPARSHDPAEVWAAPLIGAPPEADAFVDLLASAAAGELLASRGFDPPAGLAPLQEASPGGRASRPAEDLPALGPVLARTVLVGVLAVLLATIPALLLGRWMARSRSALRGPVGTLLLLPLVLPPVVTGFVLLALLGSSGPLGPLLEAAGLRLSFTLGAAVVAAAVVGFPLYAVVVRNAFEAVDPRYEELAWTLGSRPRATFLRVALPLALPGVAAGAVLALARGLGEFGATVVVAGNIEGRTQTLALAVYQLLESPEGRASIWVFVLASVVIAAIGLALWEWLGARHRARLLDGGSR